MPSLLACYLEKICTALEQFIYIYCHSRAVKVMSAIQVTITMSRDRNFMPKDINVTRNIDTTNNSFRKL